MLKKATFISDWRCFKKGDTFEFRPGVTLLVGDQGTGKSSLFEKIRSEGKKRTGEVVLFECELMDGFSFDFEKENPRTASYIENAGQVVSRFNSHGQTTLGILGNISSGFKEAKNPLLILMDEPDMSLSIRSVCKLAKLLKGMVKKGAQVISTAHSQTLIEQFPEVLSLEHRKWMTSAEFIQSQKAAKRKRTSDKLVSGSKTRCHGKPMSLSKL